MPIDKKKFIKDLLAKALECKTADDLVSLAKANGVTLTKEEAEAYLAELDDIELDEKALDKWQEDPVTLKRLAMIMNVIPPTPSALQAIQRWLCLAV